MTAAADLLLTNAEVHTLADPDEIHEAVAVRDGRIVRVGSDFDVQFLAGTDTDVVDCGGDVVLPGFVDAHTHLPMVGRALVHADLSGTASPAEAVDRLRDRAADVAPDEWVLGFRYDESAWPDGEYLTRGDLDDVSADAPVAAVREDIHLASLNSVALDRLRDRMPNADVRTEAGEPTGVVVEGALDALFAAVKPDLEEMRDLLRAATRRAVERGITGVHDMVRRSHAPRAYRDLEATGELPLRVRLNYWADHLDALAETGLRTNHGSEMVTVGAVKIVADGSIGGRTAKLSRAYADADTDGTWLAAPDELAALVAKADDAGYQVAVHAIGDDAVDAAVEALAAAGVDARHRIEHLELASDAAIDRMADAGLVASMQPNFHRWAAEGDLYDARLGARRAETNRLRAVVDAGVPLAFGSDCMPMDPLYGLHHAVNAPSDEQSLSVDAALRAYTAGAAYAGFAERRRGTLEVGTDADLVVLDESPWRADDLREVNVDLTVVDGRIVYDA